MKMKNLSGRKFLAKNNNLYIAVVAFLVLLAGCAGPAPIPAGKPATQPAVETEEEVQQRVREPARQSSAGAQVFPLQNPAVKSLLADAGEAESVGDYDAAAVSLERALRIQPRDPEILQAMAEIQLHKKDYDQALSFAIRSYDAGARVGEICSRNWHTISVAREHLADSHGAAQARQRAGKCVSAKPQSY